MRLLLAPVLLASTQAFVPHAIPFCTRQSAASPSNLRSTSTSEEAIEDAMRISKDKGATSQEARVAWDIVEELNASDNSAAFTGGINDGDCLVGDLQAPPEECNDYVAGVEAIAGLQRPAPATSASDLRVAESVRPVSLSSDPSPRDGDSAAVTAGLLAALESAKRTTAELGIASSEARLAWETVEEMAASGTSEATKGAMDEDECLVEKIEACEALEELDRAISLEANKENGRYQG